MKLLTQVKILFNRLISRKKIPVWQGERTNINIEYAFTCGGRRFFYVRDPHNMPYMRLHTAYQLIEGDLNRGVPQADLVAALETIISNCNEILNNRTGTVAPGAITNTKQIAAALRDKMKFGLDIDCLYNVAGCVFFTEHEDPTNYDPEIAAKNIDFWKANKAKGFFLNLPLSTYLPDWEQLAKSVELKEAELIAVRKSFVDILTAGKPM